MTTTAMAQTKQFTLEDLNFGGNRYRYMTPERRYYEWWGDQLLEVGTDGARPVYINKVLDDLFTLDDLKAADPTLSHGVNILYTTFPYPDKPLALIKMHDRRLLFNFKKKKIEWSQKRGEGSLEWNEASRVEAFSKGDNLWLRKENGDEVQLTNDGSREIVYGKSVHRDEFGITKGTFFSPDGNKLAFYRMDQSMVADYPQVNTFTREAEYEPDKYPMAGMTSHKVTVHIADIKKVTDNTAADGVGITSLKLGDVTDRYFTNIAWGPDGKRLYLIELNRKQNKATLDEYDALTGEKLRTLDTETDEKYVEPLHPITFLPWDDNKFVMWSQRDGYWHLYLYDLKEGKCIKQLTKGEYVVMELCGFNSKKKSIIIKANKSDAMVYSLYYVNVETCAIKPIDNEKGVHYATVSASGEHVLDHWSEPDVPRCYAIRHVEGEKPDRVIFESKDPWKDYAQPTFRHGTIKAADGVTDLHYRLVLPPYFIEDLYTSKKKQHPAVVYVYGGPHAHNIDASWHWASRPWETYMAQKGYVLFILDNRGSENRGKEFEQVTWHQLGQVEMLDQMKGVEYLQSLPYINKEKIGVHGWSYGGYMTISLITNYPDVFKVGVAGGPVIDWKWYEVMYGERYMGTPEDNPEGYKKTSLLNKAKDLKGRLQIIIGMNDNIVVPQHALGFLNACNEEMTYPDFYVYPGEEHNMRGHQSVHLHERITDYFERNLK